MGRTGNPAERKGTEEKQEAAALRKRDASGSRRGGRRGEGPRAAAMEGGRGYLSLSRIESSASLNGGGGGTYW